MRPRRFYYTVI